jgi:hypothetical protein
MSKVYIELVVFLAFPLALAGYADAGRETGVFDDVDELNPRELYILLLIIGVCGLLIQALTVC